MSDSDGGNTRCVYFTEDEPFFFVQSFVKHCDFPSPGFSSAARAAFSARLLTEGKAHILQAMLVKWIPFR